MADEINPRTGKPYSKNPRAVSARRKTQQKKSDAANQREEEAQKTRIQEGYESGQTTLTPEQIEINKKGLEEAKKKIREGGAVQIPEDGKNTLLIEGMSPEMQKSYERNKGNPKFNKEMEDYREKLDKGELTDEDRIRILNKNKDLLQISQLEKMRRVFGPVVNTGRNALAIIKGGITAYRTLSGFK